MAQSEHLAIIKLREEIAAAVARLQKNIEGVAASAAKANDEMSKGSAKAAAGIRGAGAQWTSIGKTIRDQTSQNVKEFEKQSSAQVQSAFRAGRQVTTIHQTTEAARAAGIAATALALEKQTAAQVFGAFKAAKAHVEGGKVAVKGIDPLINKFRILNSDISRVATNAAYRFNAMGGLAAQAAGVVERQFVRALVGAGEAGTISAGAVAGLGTTVGALAIAAAAAGAAILYAAKKSLDFDVAMRGVAVRIKPIRELFVGLKDEVLALSATTGIAKEELADSLSRALIRVGGNAVDAMEVLRVAANAAQGALTDTGNAVTQLTDIIRAYGLHAFNIQRVSNVVIEAMKAGRAEFMEVAPGIADLAPQAQALGVRFEEVAATLAHLTRAGIPAQQAIFALRNIMSKMLDPTSEMSRRLTALGVRLDMIASRPVTPTSSGGFVGLLQEIGQKLDYNGPAIGRVLGESRLLGAGLSLMGQNVGEVGRTLAAMSGQADRLSESLAFMRDTSGVTVERWMQNVGNGAAMAGMEMEELVRRSSMLEKLITLRVGPLTSPLAPVAARMAMNEARKDFQKLMAAEALTAAQAPERAAVPDPWRGQAESIKTATAALRELAPQFSLAGDLIMEINAGTKELVAGFMRTPEFRDSMNEIFVSPAERGRKAMGGAVKFYRTIFDLAKAVGFVITTDIVEAYKKWADVQGRVSELSEMNERFQLSALRGASDLAERLKLTGDRATIAKTAFEQLIDQLLRLNAAPGGTGFEAITGPAAADAANDLATAIQNIGRAGSGAFGAVFDALARAPGDVQLLVEEMRSLHPEFEGLLDPISEALERVQSGLSGGVTVALDEFVIHARETFRIGREAGAEFAQGLQSAFAGIGNSLIEGRNAFENFGIAVLQMLNQVIAKIWATWAAAQVLGFLGIGGGGPTPSVYDPGGPGVPSVAQPDSGGVQSFAMGGSAVLRGGGVTRRPTMIRMGDNQASFAEAFVPLPGPNRGILVEFRGGGGGRTVNATINLVVQSLDPSTAASVVLAQMPRIQKALAGALNGGRDREFTIAVRGA